MCGIVGHASNGYTNHQGAVRNKYSRVLSELLWIDSLRGWDSTGVVFVPRKAKEIIEVYKKAIPGSDFVQQHVYQNLVQQDGWNAVIGHNRSATKGSVSSRNAHPFYAKGKFGEIYMVHNGTVYNKHTLPRGDSYPTDSEAICNAIVEIGLEATIERITGSFSLVWYNNDDSTLNFIRNDDRPMELIWDKNRNNMWFCSEKEMLEFVLLRNSIEIGQHETLPPKTYWKFDLKNVSVPSEMREIKTYTYTKPAQHQSYFPRQDDPTVGKEHKALRKRFADHFRGKKLEFQVISVIEKEDYYNKNIWLKFVEGITNDKEALEVEGTAPISAKNIEEGAICAGVVYGWRPVVYQGYKELLILVNNISVIKDAPIDNDTKLSDLSAWCIGPRGMAIPVSEFDELTKHGCAQCQTNITPDMHKTITWTDDRQPICQNCTSEKMDERLIN